MAEESADELFGKYSQEIKRLSHSMGVDGNPPDGYREIAPLITQAVERKPDDPEIRLSAIYYDVILALYKDLSVDEMIAKYRNYIAATKEFKRNFPDWPKRLYKASRPNVRVSLLNNAFDIGKRLEDYPASKLPELLAVFEELRQLCHDETLAAIDKTALEKPFTNAREQRTFCENMLMETGFIITNQVAFQTYRDIEKVILKRYLLNPKMECLCLYGKDFMMPDYQSFPGIVEECPALFESDLSALREALDDTEYMELLGKTSEPHLVMKKLALEALSSFVQSKERAKALETTIVSLYQKAEKALGKPLSPDDVSEYFHNFHNVMRWLCEQWLKMGYSEYDDKASTCYVRYQQSNKGSLPAKDYLTYLQEKAISSNDFSRDFLDELNARVDELSKIPTYELLQGNPYDVAYSIVSSHLFRLRLPQAQETIRKLCPLYRRLMPHPDFAAQRQAFKASGAPDEAVDLAIHYPEYRVCASVKAVYVLYWTLFYKFDVSTGEMNILPAVPIAPMDFRHSQISIEEGKRLLARTEDHLAVYDLEKAEWTHCACPVPGILADAVIIGESLFLLSKQKGAALVQDIALYECDLDGGNPMLRFSTSDRASVRGLPSDRAFAVSKLVRLDDKRLLFMLVSQAGYEGAILQYDISNGKSKALHSVETTGAVAYLEKMPDGRIIGSSKRGYFVFQDNSISEFVNRSPSYVSHDAKYNLKTYNVSHPFLITDDDILFSPERQFAVNLRSPGDYPSAWLPKCGEIMALPERQFAMVNPLGVYLFAVEKNPIAATKSKPFEPPQVSVIPMVLRIFRAIYEWRFWYLIPLFIVCGVYASWLLHRRRKRFFVWLLVFPLFIGGLWIAATYCGWHYRMELRQRFAAYSPDTNAYSIDRMPADIRHEYAKHDYRPRFRDVKAMVLWDILYLPLLYAIGGMLWLCSGKKKGKEDAADTVDNAVPNGQQESSLPPRPAITACENDKGKPEQTGGQP
ncbi:MAG: hypothetical protein IJJ33_13990 [Victivallales bacterium]|nr:hypothetical protein [Victivallales bacterium]